MATIKVKPKVEKEPKDIAGRIIGVLFLLMVIAGGYYLFDMFRQLDITNDNIQGEWRYPKPLGQDTTECWVFSQDNRTEEGNTGVATNYTLNTKDGSKSNIVEYDYVLEQYTDKTGAERYHIMVTTKNVKASEKRTREIRVTSLSKMEISVTFVEDMSADITRMVRTTVF